MGLVNIVSTFLILVALVVGMANCIKFILVMFLECLTGWSQDLPAGRLKNLIGKIEILLTIVILLGLIYLLWNGLSLLLRL